MKVRGITLFERAVVRGFPVRLLSQVLLHNLIPTHGVIPAEAVSILMLRRDR